MVLAVGILITGHGAVCHTQGEVCIGIEGALLVPFAQCLHICAVPLLDCGHIAQVAVSIFAVVCKCIGKPACELHHGIGNVLLACQRILGENKCVGEHVVNKSLGTAMLLNSCNKWCRDILLWHTCDIFAEHSARNCVVNLLPVVVQVGLACFGLFVRGKFLTAGIVDVEPVCKVEELHAED